MSSKSGIEWTEKTWNPTTGCTRVSAGCQNCYAYNFTKRLQGTGHPRYANGFDLTVHWDQLDVPRRWVKPRRVFVNSMSDLFHCDVPAEFIQRVFETIVACPQHTFQILTKRSDRVAKLVLALSWPRNLWMGVTVEDCVSVERISDLASIPAAVRFVSFEPLLEDLGELDLDDIDWVIVGGETGPRSRPMKTEWVQGIFDQARALDIPFFFKRWGGRRSRSLDREWRGKHWEQYPVASLGRRRQ